MDDDLPIVTGHAELLLYPDDVAFFSDEERDEWRAEVKARVARKRPLGFAPWPDEGRPDDPDS